MILTTKRLLLRPWEEKDAESLYEIAKEPDVLPAAGGMVHANVDFSLKFIKYRLSKEETYAIVLRNESTPIGNIALKIEKFNKNTKETELAFWLSKEYWGQGIILEAIKEILKHCLNNLKIETVWCGFYEGNVKCKRVLEKAGFKYDHTIKNYPCNIMSEYKTAYFMKFDLQSG